MTDQFDNQDPQDPKDKNEYDQVCFVCRRPESKAGKMFRLPGGINICNDCMHKTLDGMENMDLTNMPMMNGFPGFPGFPGMNGVSQSDENETAQGRISPVETTQQSQSDEDDDPQTTQEEAPETEDTQEEKKSSGRPFPNISFINLADLQNMTGIPNRQRVKKKPTKTLPPIKLEDIPAPHKIKAQLDDFVIGQEQAKKILSVAVYNHYKRVATDTMDEIEIEKSNILMLGPTGSGKTYLVQTLAKLLNVPLAIADATTLTEAGYIGDDIESVVSKLLAAAGNDVAKAETGIIFIDEIDKIAKKKNTTSRDVSGESVQQGLLKLLEGAEVEVPVGANSKNAMVPLETVNTRNILFICGGAFPGLEEVIKQRLSKQTSIGFSAELKDRFDKEKNLLSQATVEDVKKFGMIPEFVGRLPILCTLENLDEDALVRILKEPKNAILKQYQKLLELDEVQLLFDDSALHAIAKKALERETGARGLRAVIEEFMLDIMYEIPKDENIGTVTITGDYIEGKGGPVIELRGEAALPKKDPKALPEKDSENDPEKQTQEETTDGE
ncbi:MAG: ATP-dependent Clp protease ATP-binding subunit ClpX [Lachnospiraceae bacterium]|nr:ATP-dependent Clp protease ATP-binding subunit ClpX [Lachnospiraceae bacterium]